MVEDDPEKARILEKTLREHPDVGGEDITVVNDIVSAKRQLVESVYDLMLLDIQIPQRYPNKADVEGGAKLLKEIIQSPNKYHLPFHIIGITAYDLSGEVDPLFQQHTWTIIRYDQTSDAWKIKLKNKINYLFHSKRSFKAATGYNYDIAIICAMDKTELEAIRANISKKWIKIEVPNDDCTNYYGTTLVSNDKTIKIIAAAAPQMGMPASSIVATKVVSNFQPRYLAMAGIAAGVKGKVNFGDIMVADPTWDYGNGKYSEKKGAVVFLPDPRQQRLAGELKAIFSDLSTDLQLLNKIQNAWQGQKPETKLKMTIGPIASGAAVLAVDKIPDSIKKMQRKLIGIEMETYGVYLAAAYCHKPAPKVFSIKSVSDFADSKKSDSYREYAAYTSACLVKEFIIRYL